MTERVVRIAAGQGFWGDWLEAPVRQVRGGPIDYLMMDYLAEVTMSIMQKQKSRDPKAGYARDFVPLMERILPDIVRERHPGHLQRRRREPARLRRGGARGGAAAGAAGKVRVGLVTGDDILGRLDDLIARGHPLADMETGRPLADDPRQGALRQRVPRHGADRRGAARRGECGGDRPGDRYRAHARTDLPRVRLVARGLGQGGGRDRGGTHHRVRRAGARAATSCEAGAR